MNKIIYKELIAFHPGYYIKQLIDEKKITQIELGKQLKISKSDVNNLINGKLELSKEIALNLSDFFGTSVSMWENLNNQFKKKYLEIEKRMEKDKKVGLIPKLV